VPDRVVNPRPLGEQLLGKALPAGADPVELPRPGLVGVPGAREHSLALESSQQRVEGVRFDGKPEAAEAIDQGVPVARLTEQQQARQDDRAAPELLLAAGEDLVVFHGKHNTV
jgi:hypothetical protein